MGRKRHTAEEIVSKLRQVDVLTSQGHAVADAIRAIGVTEVTYYRWRTGAVRFGKNWSQTEFIGLSAFSRILCRFGSGWASGSAP
jgi:transposase-like protein